MKGAAWRFTARGVVPGIRAATDLDVAFETQESLFDRLGIEIIPEWYDHLNEWLQAQGYTGPLIPPHEKE